MPSPLPCFAIPSTPKTHTKSEESFTRFINQDQFPNIFKMSDRKTEEAAADKNYDDVTKRLDEDAKDISKFGESVE